MAIRACDNRLGYINEYPKFSAKENRTSFSESDTASYPKSDVVEISNSHFSRENESASENFERKFSAVKAINFQKHARRLAAAKTKAQLNAVISEIQRDISSCKMSEQQGITVDSASLSSARIILDNARLKMGQVSDREADPQEEMAFSMAKI